MIETIYTTDLQPEEITSQIIATFIQRHATRDSSHLKLLYEYYIGKQAILDRTKDDDKLANERLVINHASYIADFTSGYFLGTPVTYSDPGDKSDPPKIQPILDVLKKADSATQDSDLALDGAIFGRSYEYIYMSTDERPTPKLARVSPLNAFVVYDDTVEQNPVFGVFYYPTFTPSGEPIGFKGTVCNSAETWDIVLDLGYTIKNESEHVIHPFGKVPLDEIYNDGQRFGDFERVLTLIDAYNLLQSDRVNDKEQFVEALLVIKGQILGDTADEENAAYEAIKEKRVMMLDHEADAAFLTRQFDESSVEVLKNSIVTDIHKISCVPDMSDQQFAGNVSGVAMKYKLLGLEQRTKTKQRFFTEGLRYRLECIANALTVQGAAAFDLENVEITFTRSLPPNEQELAQAVTMLQGIVSNKTLLSLLPFVTDADTEVEAVEQEKAEAMQRQIEIQQAMIKAEMNTPIDKAEL